MTARPEPLAASHATSGFESGEPSLDDWLNKRAVRNQNIGASRCFVVSEDGKVVGYYALSAGAVARDAAPKAMQRNMPDPVPVLVLGRLAVDRRSQGKGLGAALLKDAILRTLHLAEETGIVAVLVHALNDAARQFYLSHGFMESPLQPMTLCLPLASVRERLGKN